MKSSLLLTLFVSPFLSAGEFSPGNIPADAQWYLHADVEKLRDTTMGKTIIEAAVPRPGLETRIQALSLP